MNSLLRFIIKYSFPIVFIIVEIFCFTIFFSKNPFQRYKFINSLTAVSSSISESWSELTSFIHLKDENKELQEENRRLRDNLEKYRTNNIPPLELSPFSYIAAKIVGKKLHNTKNFYIIDKGANNKIYEGMGVIGPNGVVGKIFSTSKNHSVILPIINPDSRVSVKFSKNDYLGSLLWEDNSINTATLTEIPGYVDVQIGDTIVTSSLSPTFPENIPVGEVKSFEINKSTNFYTIEVGLFTDFSKLNYAYIIDNSEYLERSSLIEHD